MSTVAFVIVARDRAWRVIDKIHDRVGHARCARRPHVFRRMLDSDDRYWCCRWCGLFESRP